MASIRGALIALGYSGWTVPDSHRVPCSPISQRSATNAVLMSGTLTNLSGVVKRKSRFANVSIPQIPLLPRSQGKLRVGWLAYRFIFTTKRSPQPGSKRTVKKGSSIGILCPPTSTAVHWCSA